MTAPIVALDTRLLRVPLTRPWGEDVRDLGVIAVTVRDADGALGHGFSWTPTIGAEAVQALLDHDIRDFALGRPADAEPLWDDVWLRLHEAGGGGITTIATAGLDLALWDLAARRAGQPIADLLGRRRFETEAYGSGVNLHYSLEELVAQTERWVAAGFGAVKVKVGSPDLARDAERLAAVRSILGPDRRLMIDANQRWDVPTAIRALDALAAFDLAWIEEPLRADDLPGHVALRAALSSGPRVPIALGENLHTAYRFREFLDAGVVDVIQPNAVRVGGITPFRRIAALAAERRVQVAPHLLTELSGRLAMTLPQECLVEVVEDASFGELGALAAPAPVEVVGHRLRDTATIGLGLRFAGGPDDEDAASAGVAPLAAARP
ncbi:mandelate racemase/muconate lactonizing enzyme family protein [Agromyces seonyuensis]|uniref:Mandelate racemase/muconate lactonizing enzyme family protein n=1 Tax=Agromyces seonyuensis TaxID=2662446 RepID=A0A6I4NZ08_9MICO|nr:mandelate racemase/muconate lactonizing enzyme family protein [Agromyces seonyuensis]MWB99381.1 mandelate racemase/muconate lactonizing enzyme family protein [Agromyces seonyuensis]